MESQAAENGKLLDFAGGSGLFELLLGVLGFGLGDGFLDGGRQLVDLGLGFLEAQTGQGAHDLDDGDLVAAGVAELSKLPSKPELLAMTLGTMNAVPTNFVSLFANVIRGALYALTAIKEKKEAA